MRKSWRVTTRKRARAVFCSLSAAALVAVSACGGGGAGSSSVPQSVTIAYQPGISYAPLILIKETGSLEKKFPNTDFTWKKMDSGAAIRDGVIANQIQVGAGGVGPLILGWSKGVGWRYLAPMNTASLWLTATDSKYRTVKDFKQGGRIGMPSPTSIQSVILRKAAQKHLGNARAFDSQIVSMGHPEGLQALLSGQIAGHLTSPPFEFVEEQEGAHVVARSSELFGEHTFNGVLMTEDYYQEHKKFARGLFNAVKSATEDIKNDPAKAAKILAEATEGTTAAEYEQYITHDAIRYTVEPKGLMRYAEFMHSIGMVEKKPGSWKDLVFPPVQKGNGS